ncbi:hypothetical protein HDU98_004718, partial [Podochytrium sp. JEL0797]
MSEVRKRAGKGTATGTQQDATTEPEPVVTPEDTKKQIKSIDELIQESKERDGEWVNAWTTSLVIVTLLSLLTRMYRIQDPAKVVFDEVHFGKFASYYLRGEYYFDVHPPLGKMMLGAVAAFAGYDGHYLFDEIGDDYVANGVPWVTMRLFPALCGSLIVPFCFLTLKEIGVSLVGALFGACLLIF